ncbi:septum formation inhibitor Maf [Aliidiomarina iranensis]|uniref:dTTP/UTP pyrophosphatase n=1 Tax=Aliidiomarina iranensis TaxID=1434071 RepID=A0A432W2N3_9GAMM|nr:Maf family protein [Aliidiomarina iranensis]RUO23475.1 septum formation inhibitor Maf [Aliidiomarina iranensis]
MSHLILASASPRRKELLQLLGVPFSTQPADILEEKQAHETPREYVERLAYEKAAAVLASEASSANVERQAVRGSGIAVLGSDTVVVCDDKVLEKPVDFAHFKRMMAMLSGRSHQVYTAVSLLTQQQNWHCCVVTEVSFRALSDEDIQAYWASGEPLDKAGGYGIQGLAGKFVTGLNGSYFAVVGLPLYETEHLLKQWLAADSG